MSIIASFLASPVAEALGWTVLHSLWQASLLALVLNGLLKWQTTWTANRRYCWAYGLLIGQLAVSVLTFSLLYEQAAAPLAEEGLIFYSTVEPSEILVSELSWLDRLQSIIAPSLPLIVGLWLCGMLFFLLRLASGYLYWHQLRTQDVSPVPESWMTIFQDLLGKLNIRRRVDLKLSDRISSPMLLGQFKPLILLPVALVNHLSTEQVEAILVHELAHFRRFDFALNVLQLIVEAIFYYHPAVWWISSQVRDLREHCCDDQAVHYTGNSLLYAQTLMEVADRRNRHRQAFALALLGPQKKHLFIRIQRILQQPVKQPDMREKFAVTSLLVVLALFVSFGAGWPDHNASFMEDEPLYEHWMIDTLPQGKIQISVDRDGEEIDVKVEDRKIQSLVIDGEEIPPADFPKYEEMVEELLADVPPPPPPPPPAPRAPRAPDAPPAPPAPPAPGEGVETIEIRKLQDGSEVIEVTVIDGTDEDNVWVTEDDDRIIIRKMDKGNAVFIEELEGLESEMVQTIDVRLDSIDGEPVKTVTIVMDNDFEFEFDEEDFEFEFDDEKMIEIEREMDEQRIIIRKEQEQMREEQRQMRDEQRELRDRQRSMRDEERRAREEERRVIIEVERAERAEEMEVRREEIRAEMEVRRAEMEVRREEMEREMEAHRRAIEAEVEARRSMNSDNWIESQLLNEGLIESTDNYRMELSSSRMKVNGKRQPAEVHQRYLELYEDHHGKPLGSGSKINISKRSN